MMLSCENQALKACIFKGFYPLISINRIRILHGIRSIGTVISPFNTIGPLIRIRTIVHKTS